MLIKEDNDYSSLQAPEDSQNLKKATPWIKQRISENRVMKTGDVRVKDGEFFLFEEMKCDIKSQNRLFLH